MPTMDEGRVYGLVLGKVIAHHRERRGWSQGQLAEYIGVGQSSLSRFETGQSQPDAYTFGRLAQVFGLTVGELAAQVDRAVERARATAAPGAPAGGTPWWQVALGVAGIVGLAAIATFAVAAALQDEDEDEDQ